MCSTSLWQLFCVLYPEGCLLSFPGGCFYHQKFIHTLQTILSHLLLYIPPSSKESPLFFNTCISHVFKRSLSHLVFSWGNHTFRASGKVSNLLQLIRSFPCTSYKEEILLTKLIYNPAGLCCCYVRHSNMPKQ